MLRRGDYRLDSDVNLPVWSLSSDTGDVGHVSRSQPTTEHVTTSRDPDHFQWQQPADHDRRSDVEPVHCDVTVTTSGLSALLGDVPLFYVALTSGASFAACMLSMCPSWAVALVAMTSLVSFAADSVHSYVAWWRHRLDTDDVTSS